MKAQSTVKKHLRELRALIDSSDDDPATMRIAYAMECAVRWATENTTGWPGLAAEAKILSGLLKKELSK